MISRRQFIRLGRAGLGVGLGTGLYTWRVEPHWVELVERPLPIANLPASLAGCRLIQLSDLHIGPRVDDCARGHEPTELGYHLLSFVGLDLSPRALAEAEPHGPMGGGAVAVLKQPPHDKGRNPALLRPDTGMSC